MFVRVVHENITARFKILPGDGGEFQVIGLSFLEGEKEELAEPDNWEEAVAKKGFDPIETAIEIEETIHGAQEEEF